MISMSSIFFSCFLVIVLTNAYLVIFYLMLNFVYEKAEKLWMMLSSTKKVKHFSGGQVEDGLILLISQWILFKLFFFFFFFLAGRMYSTLALLLDHSHYLQAMLLWGFNYKLGLSTSVLNFDRSWTTATDPPVLHYWWNLWASTNFCTKCCSVSLSVFILRGW